MNGKLEVPFPHLIDDMRELTEKYRKSAMSRKAMRVYQRCLSYGHTEWAESIAEKYKLNTNIQSDLFMAMSYGLAAAKHFGLNEGLMP